MGAFFAHLNLCSSELPSELWNLIVPADARLVGRLSLALGPNSTCITNSLDRLIYNDKIGISQVDRFNAAFARLTACSVHVGAWDVQQLVGLPTGLTSLTLMMTLQNFFVMKPAPECDFAYMRNLTRLEELIIDCGPNKTKVKRQNYVYMSLKRVFASCDSKALQILPQSVKTLRFLRNQHAVLELGASMPKNLMHFENHTKSTLNSVNLTFLPSHLVELRLPHVSGSFDLLTNPRVKILPPHLKIISTSFYAHHSPLTKEDTSAWPRQLEFLEIYFAPSYNWAHRNITQDVWDAAPKTLEHLRLHNFLAPNALPRTLKSLCAKINVREAFPHFPDTLEELELSNPYTGEIVLSVEFVQTLPPRLKVLRQTKSVVVLRPNVWKILPEALKEYFEMHHKNSVVKKCK